MALIIGIVALVAIFVMWKLFIDGWLFKIILFFGGWFGIYIFCRVYVEGSSKIAVTLGSETPVSFTWAATTATAICFLTLLFTKVNND